MHKTRLRCFAAKSVGRCRETLRAAIVVGAGLKFDRAFLKNHENKDLPSGASASAVFFVHFPLTDGRGWIIVTLLYVMQH